MVTLNNLTAYTVYLKNLVTVRWIASFNVRLGLKYVNPVLMTSAVFNNNLFKVL